MKSLASVFVLLCFCWNGAFAQCESQYFYGGMPKVTRTVPGDRILILTNCGYVVAYSEARRNPLWSAYHLRKMGAVGFHSPAPPRTNPFKTDDRTTIRVLPTAYEHTGFDRGHMAPRYGIGSRFGKKAQDETFF